MEEKVIQGHLKKEFVLKSAPAAVGVIAVAFVFLLINGMVGPIGIFANCLVLGIIFINFLRFYNSYLFRNNRIRLNEAIKKIKKGIFYNVFLWFIYSILLINYYNFVLNYIVLFLFLILIAYSTISIGNLFWNNFLLYTSTMSYILPIIIYGVVQTISDHQYGRITVILFFAIFFYFNLKQAKVLLTEAHDRFIYAENLKISLIENEKTHKELERETFNKLQASRMASIVDFASGVAHEINNPLTIIQIANKNLIEGDYGPLSEVQIEKLTKIRNSIERIDRVVTSLKNVTHTISFDDFTDNRLDHIFETVLEIYYEKLKLNNIKLNIDSIPHVFVQCIAPQVSQIIMSIIDNAVDALSSVEHSRNLEIRFHVENSKIRIRFINNGPIIENEVIEKIFHPFFTTKPIGKGPGLGLTLSRSLASGNGGTLDYELLNGKVCFVLTLKKSR